MNRRRFLRGVAAAATPVAAVQALSLAARDSAIEGEKGQRDARGITESKRRIFRATAAAMSLQRRDWEQGILAQAMLRVGEREKVILLTKAAISTAIIESHWGAEKIDYQQAERKKRNVREL